MSSVGTMIHAGCTGTDQCRIAHQTPAHFTRITPHAVIMNHRIDDALVTRSGKREEFTPSVYRAGSGPTVHRLP